MLGRLLLQVAGGDAAGIDVVSEVLLPRFPTVSLLRFPMMLSLSATYSKCYSRKPADGASLATRPLFEAVTPPALRENAPVKTSTLSTSASPSCRASKNHPPRPHGSLHGSLTNYWASGALHSPRVQRGGKHSIGTSETHNQHLGSLPPLSRTIISTSTCTHDKRNHSRNTATQQRC